MSCLTDPAGADPSDQKGPVPIMTDAAGRVGGIDSHKDTIHVAVITDIGQHVEDKEFPTTQAGYRRAAAWLIGTAPWPRSAWRAPAATAVGSPPS